MLEANGLIVISKGFKQWYFLGSEDGAVQQIVVLFMNEFIGRDTNGRHL